MAENISDFDILEAWRGGDREAGEALLARHFDSLYRFLSGKVEVDEVDDLLQRSFAACVGSKGALRGEASFRSYLFTVARNELCAFYRRRSRDRERFEPGSVSVAQLGVTPSEAMARSEDQRLLLRALRRIPLDQQIAIELYYWEELSTEEIAQVLGVPAGTVRSRLAYARKHLEGVVAELSRAGLSHLSAHFSTEASFDRWARSVHARVPAKGPEEPPSEG